MQTVVALYDRFEDARHALDALKENGFQRDKISLIANDQNGEYSRYMKDMKASGEDIGDGTAAGAGIGAVLGGLGGLLVGLGALAIPGIGPVLAAGPIISTLAGAGIGAVAGGLVGALVDLGIPDEHAHAYAEGVRRGGTLVVLQTEDNMTGQATQILNRFHPVDIEQRMSTWKQDNWSGFDENAGAYQGEMSSTSIPVTGGMENDTTIPVIEEDIDVGKREVDRGGVRISSHIEEEPVEKDVHLRNEHINVERKPVNRMATDEDFKEGAAEFHEKGEEPFVNKQARVTEEIHVNKDVEDTTETIRDSVKRQRVDVENIDMQDFNRHDADYRKHFQSQYGSTGMNYDTYMPAYRFGYALANDKHFANSSWDVVEQEARQEWERTGNQARWADVRDAVRRAWETNRRRM